MQQGYTIKLKESNNAGSTFEVTVIVPRSLGWLDDMYMVTQTYQGQNSFKISFDREEGDYVVFKNDVFLYTSAVYRLFFTFTANRERKYLDKNMDVVSYLENNNLDKLSVNFDTPEWAKGAIMYHIFVDRFKRGSRKHMKKMPHRDIKKWDDPLIAGPNENGEWNVDFYGGDLKGIIDKLEYIKSLGTDILYLSPVVKSQSNHRYDTGDYETVDPYAGTNEDLKKLCDKAHLLNMKVVLDAVFNHTGNDSKYFNELGSYDNIGAYQDINSYYGSFYRTWYNSGKTYFDYWWGMQNLPVCNGNSKNWQEYIYGRNGVIDKWFELGIDGLRLDVADELTDEFIEGIRTAVKRNKEDGLIIGEVWKNAMRMGRGYIASGKGMDTQMDYPLVDALMRYFKFSDVHKLSYIIQDMLNEYPKGTIDTLMNFTSTHDISRPINIFGSDEFKEYSEWVFNNYINDPDYVNKFELTPEQYEKGKEIFKTYLFTLNFMPGMLSIFYGDERGITGLGNLLNRQPIDWKSCDGNLLRFCQSIGRVRNKEPFLKTADLKMIDINNNYMMFERNSNEGDALIAVNRTPEDQPISVPSHYEKYNHVYRLYKSQDKNLTPYGGIAIIRK